MRNLFLIVFLSVASLNAAYTEFYVQTTGSNLNAGSDANDAAEFTFTSGNFDADATGSTHVFTAAGADLSGVAVGEWASVYADGASVAVYIGRITAVDNGADTITISTTAKSGTAPTDGTGNRSIKVGGAWAGWNSTSDFPHGFIQNTMEDASGNIPRVNIKGGTTYNATDGITHALPGPIVWEAYTTAVGDGGRATISGATAAAGTVFPLLTLSSGANGHVMKNITFDQNYSGTPSAGLTSGNAVVMLGSQQNYFYRCRFMNGYRSGLEVDGSGAASGSVFEECEAYRNNWDDALDFGGFKVLEESVWINCWSHHTGLNIRAGGDGADSSGWVFTTGTAEPAVLINCGSTHNLGDGMRVLGNVQMIGGEIAYNGDNAGTDQDGVDLTSASLTALLDIRFRNVNIIGNAGYGIRNDGVGDYYPILTHVKFYGNTSGETLNLNSSFIDSSTGALTGSPYTDTTGDFRPNNTSGAGAATRGAGRGQFLIDTTSYSTGASTVAYPDIGAVQHQDSGGSGGTRVYIGQ